MPTWPDSTIDNNWPNSGTDTILCVAFSKNVLNFYFVVLKEVIALDIQVGISIRVLLMAMTANRTSLAAFFLKSSGEGLVLNLNLNVFGLGAFLSLSNCELNLLSFR